MQPVISAQQMREIDRLTSEKHNVPSLQLMENAAEACFLEIKNLFSGKLDARRVFVLCGPGNNGGDGAVIARKLAEAGATIDVVLLGRFEDTKGDARTNFDKTRRFAESGTAELSFVECNATEDWTNLTNSFKHYDAIIDALFGTGLSRPLEGIHATVIDFVNHQRGDSRSGDRPKVISIDVPSGLNADLGDPIGPAILADLTVTFTSPKMANVLPPACHLNGKLKVVPIGSPRELLTSLPLNLLLVDAEDAREWMHQTRYTPESYKNTHGHALIIAGSRGYTGAAALCGNAAMMAGAGLVTVATPFSAQNSVASALMPEVMTTALAETDRGAVSDKASVHLQNLSTRYSVVAIGPGLSSSDERTRGFVHSIVEQRTTTIVIDADGLNCLAPWPHDLQGSRDLPLVLTPHLGEMKRLLDLDESVRLSDMLTLVRDFAAAHHLIVVLKGSRTVVITPDAAYVNPTGNAGLGTAGSGDTLTGIIAAFIAQAVGTLKQRGNVTQAVWAAVYVGGFAGDLAAAELGMRGMVASDIQAKLSEAFCVLDPEGEFPRT